ncbi:molybdenum cofactor guanylyltransferase [Altererythrobacter sp. ZODW24]|uniref:molybdenum cofactor guanylyltransferase n=1 Tax=Altererythrobacter sp. ZODW24 TaxID=2185142 RepID=UPI000DF7A94E|nr:molybdenum cofactor guanylyltransferase [Altererythrobacter sp. ZODW24]
MSKTLSTRIAVVLAGGRSSRMNGVDKATFELSGKRLIDRVVDRIAPHFDIILLSGEQSYGTGLTFVQDYEYGTEGPAAGLLAIAEWLVSAQPAASGFFAVPVDAPNFPNDLVEVLSTTGKNAMACSPSGIQPTFAFWEIRRILPILRGVTPGESISLRHLGTEVGATLATFNNDRAFANLNSPKDVEAFDSKLCES